MENQENLEHTPHRPRKPHFVDPLDFQFVVGEDLRAYYQALEEYADWAENNRVTVKGLEHCLTCMNPGDLSPWPFGAFCPSCNRQVFSIEST